MEGGYRARWGDTDERAAADAGGANVELSEAMEVLELREVGGTVTDRFGDFGGAVVRRGVGVKLVGGARELLPTTLALPPREVEGAPPLDDP